VLGRHTLGDVEEVQGGVAVEEARGERLEPKSTPADEAQCNLGKYIKWYHENDDPCRLELKLMHGRAQFLEKDAVERWEECDDGEDEAEICMNDNLEETLESLRGNRQKTLQMLEAVLGERPSR